MPTGFGRQVEESGRSSDDAFPGLPGFFKIVYAFVHTVVRPINVIPI
jgi:hypothetical protein